MSERTVLEEYKDNFSKAMDSVIRKFDVKRLMFLGNGIMAVKDEKSLWVVYYDADFYQLKTKHEKHVLCYTYGISIGYQEVCFTLPNEYKEFENVPEEVILKSVEQVVKDMLTIRWKDQIRLKPQVGDYL